MNSPSFNCPKCSAPLPAEDAACPNCSVPPPIPTGAPKVVKWWQTNWAVLAVFLAPAVLSFATSKLGIAPLFTFFGSGASGLFCGFVLARRFKGTPVARTLLGLLLSGIIGAASIALCAAGCALGGFQMDMR